MARVKIMSVKDAVKLIKDGDTIAFAGFWNIGTPFDLCNALLEQGTKDLHIITIGCGIYETGPGKIITSGNVSRLSTTYIGMNRVAEKMVKEGKIKTTFFPQGNFIEKLRCAGVGIPAFFTPIGIGTMVAEGRDIQVINGIKCLMEEAFPKPDFAFIRAHKADKMGNLSYRGSAENCNPVMAASANITIVEADNIVEVGEIPPNEIVTPFNYVDIVVQSSGQKVAPWKLKETGVAKANEERDRIARRIAKEIKDGSAVNLGVGIPTLVANHIPKDIQVFIQAENGILGAEPAQKGKEDFDFCDASGDPVSIKKGGAIFDSVESFAMIRGGHLDMTVLGAFQVDAKGNVASNVVPGGRMPGFGGAMDLAVSAKKVIIGTMHTAKNGTPKIVEECTFPLTAVGTVKMIVTELAVMVPTPKGLVLKEILDPSKTAEEIQALTGAKLIIECEEK